MFTSDIEQRILNAWKTNGKAGIGHWEAVEEGGKEYITHSMIDILTLYFRNQIDKLITFKDLNAKNPQISNIDFTNIRIANTYSKSIEESPSIVVAVQDITTVVPQIGWEPNENKDEFLRVDSVGGIALTVEGRDVLECELLADRLDRGLLAFIMPGLQMLDSQIIMKREVPMSALRERVISSDFKAQQRTFSLRFKLDYIPIAWIVDEPVMTSVEVTDTPV